MDKKNYSYQENISRHLIYKIGAWAVLVAVVFFRRNFPAELSAFNGFGIFRIPPVIPQTSVEWFGFFQQDRLLGLIYFGLVDLINYFLVGLFFLGLFTALKKVNKSLALIAVVLGWAGVLLFFASNQAFGMLALSEKYAAADAETQGTFLAAAGEALLVINNPEMASEGTAGYASLLFLASGGLIFSLVMLRDNIFSKLTAWTGILANGFVLLFYFTLIFAPQLNALPHVLSAPFRVVWYVLTALRLLKLSKDETVK